MYASLQFCGNIEEYFSKNTNKLVVYIVMPRLKNKYNFIRIYKKGELVNEKKVWSSENIIGYYLSWFLHHWYILFTYFSLRENFYIIAGHPVSFFGLSIQKMLWNTKHLYWIGDYFPGDRFIIKLFEKLKKYYHDQVPFTAYLSDGINRKFNNNKIANSINHKTIMWGVNTKKIARIPSQNNFSLLFVGLIKESQGLEFIFNFLKNHKGYHLNIIGVCDNVLYKKYQEIIHNYKLKSRIFFPNKFYSDEELNEISKKSHVGIALYNTNQSNPTYYTDPGKVKAYAEMGLPVIMSDTSGIASYVKKFKCGIVLDERKNSLDKAFLEMNSNYAKYLKGLRKFNDFFYFEKYYKNSFKFLEI